VDKGVWVKLKMMLNPALFHYRICNMPRFNLAVNRKIPARKRAVPYIVVAFSASDKAATVLF
jgi:hypothetical protein